MEDVNGSVEVCPKYESRYSSREIGWYFFTVYSVICAVALIGNCFILGLLAAKPGIIQRRTFRFLTVALGICELAEASLLFLLLVRIGIGYHNRQYGTELVSPEWSTDSENEYLVRHVTLLRVLFSTRDVAIGIEIYIYSLLAIDRLLAIAAPTTQRWNTRVAGLATLSGFVVMATGEVTLQTWRYSGVEAASDAAVCSRVTLYTRINTYTKAGAGILAYVTSLCTYIATATLLLGRARSVAPDGQQRALAVEQAKKPLAALVLGNLLQFVSLLPMVIDNVGRFGMDACLFYSFFINSAAVPCLTAAFNTGIRRFLARKTG